MAPSRRRKAAPKKEETPTKSKKAKKEEPAPIVDLYRVCVTEGTEKERQESIREGQLGAAFSTVVWPNLTSGEDEHWREACHLWTLMVSPSMLDECRTKDDNNNNNKEVSWTRIWETVLWGLPESCSADVVVKAVICVLANDDSNNTIREPLLPHVSGVQLWYFVPERMRELELRKSAELRRTLASTETPERLWVVTFIDRILTLLQQTYSQGEQGELLQQQQDWQLLHVSLELLLDLLSSIATRQHLVPYLDAIHFSVRCKMMAKNKKETTSTQNHRLVHQLLVRIQTLIQFPIRNNTTNKPMSKADMISMYQERATVLQKMCHAHYLEQLPEVIYAGVGLLCNGNYLKRAMGGLSEHAVWDIVNRLRLVGEGEPVNREFGMAILLYHVTIPPFDELSSLPLYPTEQVLWNPSVIPPGRTMETTTTTSSMVLSLPKLQTQFLSFRDYLLRSFELTRLESAYEIRSDLVHVVRRVEPVVVRREDFDRTELVQTEFRGWARMALELSDNVRVVRVDPPKLGQGHPAQVVAEITIDLVHCGQAIRQEWDSLGEFDNLFLIGVDASQMTGEPAPLIEGTERRVSDEEDFTFPERFGVIAVRGCMVLHIRDEEGNILSDPANRGSRDSSSTTTKRILRVVLDPAQYAMDARSKYGTKVYESLNLVMRRHGRENNFKAVLETIRGLMEGAGSIDRVLPPWLQPLLLGHGKPDSACYKSEAVRSYAINTPGVTKPHAALDFRDTFLSEEHLRACFPGSKIMVDGEEDSKIDKDDRNRKNYRVRFLDAVENGSSQVVEATSYDFPPGVAGNPVRFTPVQVEAVRSGLNPGLTVVVGPPGTGKTDVAVQVIANLYHSFPTQRTVLITHSNAALNDLFTKVMARGDIDERYLIRLGSGERDLDIDSSHDFTKTGRVAHSLERRAALLEKVQLLSESLGISGRAERGADGSPSYTCETAKYFNMHHVQKRVKKFQAQISEAPGDAPSVGSLFPFKDFFHLEPDGGDSLTLAEATEKLSELDDIFSELAEYRPLELLRSQRQRTDYLLMKQARIVAMTCTHAAIARSHLIELGFHYDNLVMEEAGQMMEIETFIPMLLQRGESDESASALSRLKRVCLIGDHNQLPPVVKNMSFSKFSNLDQSMFSRLVRLGVPYIQLDRQGRARADIASLYSWRYNDLGNLDHVLESPNFQIANTGFAHTFQMINVDDFQGRGESTPTPYFYQNLGEAEYAVALFQYMVLIGYPPHKISILTTYNGQKDLLEDILSQRCGEGTPFAGMRPKAVSTVDQYQGQQNDHVILSLVRTQAVGHLRDVRRLVVAVSRARLGLYVICRQSLFQGCHELKRTMDQFAERPNKLQLVVGEHYPTERKIAAKIPKKSLFEVEDVAHLGVMVHQMQQTWMGTVDANA